MAEGKISAWKIGCIIAAIVFGGGFLICAGFFGWAGWSISQNPNARRAIAAVGATTDMIRDAMRAPGAEEMRRAGCTQALVLTPEIMQRFLDAIALDGGLSDQAPEIPMIFCNMAAGRTGPTCEATVTAYASAHPTPPPEIAVRVGAQGQNEPQCYGVYAPDGTFVREIDPEMRRTFGQVGSGNTQPPP